MYLPLATHLFGCNSYNGNEDKDGIFSENDSGGGSPKAKRNPMKRHRRREQCEGDCFGRESRRASEGWMERAVAVQTTTKPTTFPTVTAEDVIGDDSEEIRYVV